MKPKQLKSGNWNIVVYDYTDDKGKRHNKSFTHPNKQTVIRMANNFKKEKTVRKTPVYEDMTLKQAVTEYIRIKSHVLSPSTIRSYEGYKRSALDDLGEMVLRYIDNKKMQQYVNRLALINAPKTIRNKAHFLITVIQYFNPDAHYRIRYPILEDPDIPVPTMDEFWNIYDHAEQEMKAPIILGGLCGMRRGEICALTPDDIDDMGIHVNKAVVRDKDNKWLIKNPKTKAGKRFIPLHTDFIQIVRKGTFNLTPSYVSKHFTNICKSLGYDFHFHCLRHMFVTEMVYGGLNPLTVKLYSGHTSAKMVTDIYSKARRNQETDNKVIDIMSFKSS